MDTYLVYVGSGFLLGVPKRNLTEEEARKFGISRLLESGLYVRAKSSKPAPKEDKKFRPSYEDKKE